MPWPHGLTQLCFACDATPHAGDNGYSSIYTASRCTSAINWFGKKTTVIVSFSGIYIIHVPSPGTNHYGSDPGCLARVRTITRRALRLYPEQLMTDRHKVYRRSASALSRLASVDFSESSCSLHAAQPIHIRSKPMA